MLVIGTNMAAIRAGNAVNGAQRQVAQSMERLATGRRINSAKDDPAGFAIADRMATQIRGMNESIRNASDGLSLLQTAEGSLSETASMMQRIRELAVQSANGTYNDDDRANLQIEASELAAQLAQSLEMSNFNGRALFTTNGGPAPTTTVQIGPNRGDELVIAGGGIDLSDVETISIATEDDARAAIDIMDIALKAVSTQRATIGAKASRLESVIKSLTIGVTNLTEAHSRIVDVDYAVETMALAKAQILAQASMAMLAQANQSQQLILQLLR